MNRLRVLGAIAAAELVLAAAFFGVHDDAADKSDVAAGAASTTTSSGDGDTTTSALEGATTSTEAPVATTTPPSPLSPATTRRATATTGRSGATTPPGPADRVVLQRMATLSQPIAFAARPGEDTVMYVGEKGGRVRSLTINGDGSGATLNPTVVLDITTKVSKGGEQGLLGIAFAPSGTQLYVNYTDTAGDTRIAEYPFANGQANAGAERIVLTVDQPYANHNGGHVTFGPDGLLYIALGDGGSAGDPEGYGQRLDTLLGKILRIDPRVAGSQPYTVPADNPFVGRSGVRPEIWHYGLRNPWRFSFDRSTGEQWIADVGQGAWEEVNHIAAARSGVNFGWNRREGAHSYTGGSAPPGAVDPEYELSHGAGNCSITGGFVYRGGVIRGLDGTYVFADFCRGRLVGASGGAIRELDASIESPSSFGEDANGELWVSSLAGGVFRLSRVRAA
ncbi:MAG TPA: PQQ-dependent sugar dehydrogenase [Acidimicrobiales bacterium]|nr:PQQ-dependent sugar dehydrogenase [Acidimicrobiales bacterium]